jgi:outer membrane protein assembly factor BamB
MTFSGARGAGMSGTGLRRVAAAAGVAAVLLAAQAFGDWPEFRGPGGAGHAAAKGLPVRWSESENIAWKTPLEGLGWSSPVVWKGRVYLTTAVPQPQPRAVAAAAGEAEPADQVKAAKAADHSLRLACLDAESGRLLWEKELFRTTGPVQIHPKNSHASPTPLVSDDRIFVHFGPHGTACTTLEGDVVWQRTLAYAPQHGSGGSPAIVGDVLVLCCDGSDVQYVTGLDRRTGEVRWKRDRDTDPKKGFSFSTPLVLTLDGRTQAVCPGSDAVFAYDPATGEEIWRVDYPGGYSVVPRPVFGAGLVVLGSGYDRPVLYGIDPTGQGNVTETHVRWKLDRGAPNTPSAVVVGDEVYCVSDNGVATCLDARTGAEHWRQRLGGNYSASPLHADGLVYFQNESGEAVVVRAGKAFEEVARNQLGDKERTFASYAVVGRSFIVRSEKAVYRVGR